jgi:hypothetical protein
MIDFLQRSSLLSSVESLDTQNMTDEHNMTCRCDYDAFDEIYLEGFEDLIKHEDIAVARAMYYCKTHKICPPARLVEKAAVLLIELLKKEKGLGRGRTANRLARFKSDYWKLERWEAVETVLSIRANTKSDDHVLKTSRNDEPDKKWEKWEKWHKRRKEWLKLGTYECAAEVLDGEYSHATPSTIQNCHVEVQKAVAQGTSMAAVWFDDEFLWELGVKKRRDKRQAKKTRFF